MGGNVQKRIRDVAIAALLPFCVLTMGAGPKDRETREGCAQGNATACCAMVNAADAANVTSTPPQEPAKNLADPRASRPVVTQSRAAEMASASALKVQAPPHAAFVVVFPASQKSPRARVMRGKTSDSGEANLSLMGVSSHGGRIYTGATCADAKKPWDSLDASAQKQPSLPPTAKPDAETTSAQIERGKAVFARSCAACHSLQSKRLVGPPLNGIWGTEIELMGGKRRTVDEAYLRESIVDPNAAVHAGYPPAMPRTLFDVTEVDAVIAFLKSQS